MSTERHDRCTAPLASRAVRLRFANRARMLTTSLSRHTPHFRCEERVLRAYDCCLREVAAAGGELRLTVDRVAFALDTEDLIDFRIAYLSGHDRTVLSCLDGIVLGRPAVLWDVGANLGSISLPLARRHPDLVVELDGVRPHLARRPDLAVVFEHEPYRLRNQQKPGAATELLTSLGFILFGLPQRGATLAPFRPSMLERHIDILACGPCATHEAWP